MKMSVPERVKEVSIMIGRATEVRNCLGQGMEEYEGCVCMNNGVVAYVCDGLYYLSYSYEIFKALVDAGFKDYTFMVIASDDHGKRGPRGREIEWQEIKAKIA